MKITKKYLLAIFIILISLMLVLMVSSVNSYETGEAKLQVETKLEKYIHTQQGSVVQYQIKSQIEYEKDAIPVKASELKLSLNPIDGKYPSSVKAIGKETEYEESTGILTIKEVVDQEYKVICYYDASSEEKQERDLHLQIEGKAELETEEKALIEYQGEWEEKVTENIGQITSLERKTSDIYNGAMKANQMNGTNYTTSYQETQEITVSQKEEQDRIEITENIPGVVYKSTKIAKQDMVNLLGEEGRLEILDGNANQIAFIDKETEFAEEGTITINYENEIESIVLKTSQIQDEAILRLEHTKEIKSDMTQDIKIMNQIKGIRGETESYCEEWEDMIPWKEATTNIEMRVDNTTWTNERQNEVTFDVVLHANTEKDKLLRDPTVKIELPDEVEKVIIQNATLFHENGLTLQEVSSQINEEGRQEIVANLAGKQTEYERNEIEVTTDVKISATIILKKDIVSTVSAVNLHYTNGIVQEGDLDTGNQTKNIQMESYQANKEIEKVTTNYQLAKQIEKIKGQGLQLEVTPVNGDICLNQGDIVHEGEYIKYNIKVTNTTEETMENVSIVGNVPEGTIYGELKADYHNPSGKYEYKFLPDTKSISIDIGMLKPGESVTKFYEVRINDLEIGIEEKEIITNIQAKIEETEVGNYTIGNRVRKAEYKVFIRSSLYTAKNQWYYYINVSSQEEKQVDVKIKLPKEFIPEYSYCDRKYVEVFDETNTPEDNILTVRVPTNVNDYYITGKIPSSNILEKTEESKVEIKTTASVTENNITYQSNENRIIYEYENVSVSMTSENEGEEVKYDEEINYQIKITNIGRTNLNYPEYSFFRVNLEDVLPKNVKPISVTYDNWEMETKEGEGIVDEETGETLRGSTYTGKYKKQEAVSQKLNSNIEDENGTKMPDLQLNFTIPYQESVTIVVKTTARLVYEKTKVENSVTVTGQEIETKTSNIITHTILPLEYDNPDEPDNPDNPDDPNKPPVNPDKPGENKTYSISGIAWLDENEDGQRQTNEQLLSGIPVLLVDMKEATVIRENVKTGANGKYRFTDLKQGNYLVLLQYDEKQYQITQYQKNGVSQTLNSDAVAKKLKINGQTVTVGMIEINNLQTSLLNMDIGLIKHKNCDLKIEKSISKVTVKTNKGTKQYTYADEKLAKIEIKAKEIEGATVSIEYKITVTNQGEIAATVGKIIDELPAGWKSSVNQNWVAKTKQQLINTSIANQRLEPGKSVQVVLVASKKMTADATGTIRNTAKIEEVTNALGIEEKEISNNQSTAEVIVSVSTGMIVYVSIGIILMITIGIAIGLVYKKGKLGRKKTFLFGTVILMLVMTTNTEIQAYDAWYKWDGINDNQILLDANCETFTGGPTGAGVCALNGAGAHGDQEGQVWGYYSTGFVYSETSPWEKSSTRPSITLKKQNTTIKMKIEKENVIYGPFSVTCSQNVTYICELYDSKGTAITGYGTCDENGTSKTIRGNTTFYIKIPKEKCSKGISSIRLKASYTGTCSITKVTYRKIIFYPGDYCQPVITTGYIENEWTETVPETVWADVEWTGLPGAIEATKRDEDQEDIKLSGVQMRLHSDQIKYDQTSTTDENGYVLFDNLPSGYTYHLEELMTPYYGYLPELKMSKKMTSGTVIMLDAINTKHTGNVQIHKEDPNNDEIKLDGIGFKIKDEEGNYLIAVDNEGNVQKNLVGINYLGNLQYTSEESEATEFITDKDAQLTIGNILTGNYTLIETSIGEHGDYYEVDDDYISWDTEFGEGKGKEIAIMVTRQKSYDTEEALIPDGWNEMLNEKANQITVNNTKKYIKLSGRAWEDMPWLNGKESERNNYLFNTGEQEKDLNDKLLANVTVRLKDANDQTVVFIDKEGNVRTEIETDEKGEYILNKVLIDKLDEYYIEFTYNGMKYESVPASIEKEIVGNKAIEKDNRTNYNNSYTTIKAGGAFNQKGEHTHDLIYDKSDKVSTIYYGDNLKYGYKEQEYPINGTYEDFLIQANTKNAYNGYLSKIKSAEEIRESGMDEIENINLGVVEREQPDLSLVKDVESIQVSVNKATHVYRYGDRFKPELYGNAYDMSPQVRYASKYGSMSYSRALYASDVYYDKDDNLDKIANEELRVKMTYKIGVKSAVASLTSVVNEIEDYYDTKYFNPGEKLSVGKQIDDRGNIIPTSKLDYDVLPSGNANYYKIRIKQTNLELDGDKNDAVIYIQMEVRPDKIVDMLRTQEKIDNYAEITSYSIKDKEGKTYAGIDQDSQPGNLVIGNQDTYEDDTDKAPGIQLVLQEERKVQGTVFIDRTTEELKTRDIREGNGTYDEMKEVGVDGVTVELFNQRTGRIAQVYHEKSNTWEEARTITENGGNYEIGGFLPETKEGYQLVYTWGGQTYRKEDGSQELIRVQDYKGTIYQEKDRQKNKEWYKARDPRYSDAMDDYTIRQNIDKQTEMLTNGNKEVIKQYEEGSQLKLENGTTEDLIREIKSITPDFIVNLEYNTGVSSHRDEYDLDENGNIKMNGPYVVKKEAYQNQMKNIDFGIVERARQVMALSKKVKGVRIVLTNGAVLVNAKVGDDGQIENQVKYATYIPKSESANGQVKMEVDNEVLQGATLEVEYGFKVENRSELDYINEEYYTYGSGNGENKRDLVALDANTIIDYMDNNLVIDRQKVQGWTFYTQEDKNGLIDQGLLSKELETTLGTTNTVMQTQTLSEELQPGDIKNSGTSFKVHRLLPSILQDEDSIMENDAEIIKVIKSGGSSLITTPGNYVPSEGPKEVDEAKAETVTIVPPTGLSVNYIAYTLLAISSLGILITGMVLIKKLVLR